MFDDNVVFKKDSVIFCEGEPSHYLYIIKRGEIAIVKYNDVNKNLMLLTVLEDQDFLGEVSVLDDGVRSASAIALSSTEVIVIKKSDIKKVLRDCPVWLQEVVRTLSYRVRDSISTLSEHSITDDNKDTLKYLDKLWLI